MRRNFEQGGIVFDKDDGAGGEKRNKTETQLGLFVKDGCVYKAVLKVIRERDGSIRLSLVEINLVRGDNPTYYDNVTDFGVALTVDEAIEKIVAKGYTKK